MLSLEHLREHSLTEERYGFTDNLLGKLEKLSINSVYDIIFNIPRKYINFNFKQIVGAEIGEEVTVEAVYLESKTTYISGGRKLIKLYFEEKGTGQFFFVSFFGMLYMATQFKSGEEVFVSGKFLGGIGTKSKAQFNHPKIEQVQKSYFAQGINPIYSETTGITSKTIKKAALKVLLNCKLKSEFTVRRFDLLELREALLQVHNPNSEQMAQKAIYSLKVLEFLDFFKQLNSIDSKQKDLPSIQATKKIDVKKATSLKLTKSQKDALSDIALDLEKGTFTRRILVGETGSGKTIVAFLSVLKNAQSGNFSIVLTPLLNLAYEHFQTASELNLFTVGLLTGDECWFFDRLNTVKLPREELYNLIRTGKVDLLVATQAAFNDRLDLPESFSFLIIDEEQKFGVEQRRKLATRNKLYPHILKLTATPIPRSFALTFLESFAISFLEPRKPYKVTTKVSLKKDILKIKEQIQSIAQEHQILIIYPRIEGEGNLQDELIFWQRFFIDEQVKWITGKSKDKQSVLDDFRKNKFRVLISTTVVEVGLNIPNLGAVIIVNAESLGLLSIHQIRGRVGRFFDGNCFLLAKDIDGAQKLKPLEKYTKGIDVAKIDLETRGAGDIFGVSQVGRSFKVASFTDEREFSTALEIFNEEVSR